MRCALAAGMLMLAVSACAASREPAAQPDPAAKSAGHGGSGARLQPAPSCAPHCPGLNAVAALSESDAWAVGMYDPLPRGIYPLAEHWDGQRWTAVPIPSPGGAGEPTRSSLAAVAVDASDDAWAVGQWYPIKHGAPMHGLIEH